MNITKIYPSRQIQTDWKGAEIQKTNWQNGCKTFIGRFIRCNNSMVRKGVGVENAERGHKNNIIDASDLKSLDFDLQRKTWMGLNRFRTSHGRSGYVLVKWGFKNDTHYTTVNWKAKRWIRILNTCPHRILSGGGGKKSDGHGWKIWIWAFKRKFIGGCYWNT